MVRVGEREAPLCLIHAQGKHPHLKQLSSRVLHTVRARHIAMIALPLRPLAKGERKRLVPRAYQYLHLHIQWPRRGTEMPNKHSGAAVVQTLLFLPDQAGRVQSFSRVQGEQHDQIFCGPRPSRFDAIAPQAASPLLHLISPLLCFNPSLHFSARPTQRQLSLQSICC